MKNPNELYLVLQKKFFLEILKGEKKEEYRDFSDYYINRLGVIEGSEMVDIVQYKTIRFQLGYTKNAPQMVVKCNAILIEKDEIEDQVYTSENCNFVIELGEIIENINCEDIIL